MLVSAAYNPKADKDALCQAFLGKSINDLPTPALIVNQDIAAQNCKDMLDTVERLDVGFRVHVKTHKTLELTRLQLSDKHNRVVVSTLMEAYSLLPLVKEGVVHDILYGVPIARSRITEACQLAEKVPFLRLMVDNVDTIRHLAEFTDTIDVKARAGFQFSVFVKVDCGTHRAGLEPQSRALQQLIDFIIEQDCIQLYGFYCHSGHSYGARSLGEAKERLLEEVASADAAARYALKRIGDTETSFVLSVGATPTAHVSKQLHKSDLPEIALSCHLELHAGNYVLNDLQQFSTSLVSNDRIAVRVLADVVSTYYDIRNEFLINAGVIALARETSAVPGFGLVMPADDKMWMLPDNSSTSTVVRLSQEHGIVSPGANAESGLREKVGDRVAIVPQHACITAQGFPFFFAVRHGKVIDVWPTFHGF